MTPTGDEHPIDRRETYTVKEILDRMEAGTSLSLARIEGKLDALQSHVSAEVSHVRERVQSLEAQIQIEKTLDLARSTTIEELCKKVRTLEASLLGEEAVAGYQAALRRQRYALFGLTISVAGVAVALVALILSRI